MSNVPRDPRQLARDILAGKISIEELAREQQRRRAGGGGGGQMPPAQARPAERMPLPRVPPPVQFPRPAVRQPPAFPQRQPTSFPQRQPQVQTQRPRPMPTPAPNQRQVDALRPMPQLTQANSPAAIVSARAAEAPQTAASLLKAPARALRPPLARLLGNRASIRQGIIMMELLGKPLGLRDEF